MTDDGDLVAVAVRAVARLIVAVDQRPEGATDFEHATRVRAELAEVFDALPPGGKRRIAELLAARADAVADPEQAASLRELPAALGLTDD